MARQISVLKLKRKDNLTTAGRRARREKIKNQLPQRTRRAQRARENRHKVKSQQDNEIKIIKQFRLNNS
jgi:hypothetical protein